MRSLLLISRLFLRIVLKPHKDIFVKGDGFLLAELETTYAPLASIGGYCVIFDIVIEDMPNDFFPNRSWGVDNNPKTAV
jgi:cephalosporin hydroxylase